jgi:preprotein translocase subunit SecD
VPLTLIQESDVDATLGADSLRRSFQAGLVGLGLVLVFMVAYYRVPGLVACGALMIYAILALATFKMLPVTMTLAGIAGFILSIGMAVDANVLIFERMKEELRTGRTLSSAMEQGFDRAWSAIRDSNVSTFISCAILYWFGSRLGTSLVQGYAVTLFIGVAVSMFTAITVSRNLLQFVAMTPLAKNLGLFSPEGVRRLAELPGRRPEPARGSRS